MQNPLRRVAALTLFLGSVLLLATPTRADPLELLPGAENNVEELAKKLKDPVEAARRQAVIDLVEVKSQAAWDLVAAALADRSSLVADEAQWRLGGNADPLALAALTGKNGLGAKDAPVRLRAVEALGRTEQSIQGDVFAGVLSDRSVEMRIATLRAAERVAVAGYLDDASRTTLKKSIEALIKSERVERVRATALVADYAMKPLDLEDLGRLRNQDDHSAAETAAAQVLAVINPTEIITRYKVSLESLPYSTARVMAAICILRPTASSARSLTSILQRHGSLRLQWMIVDTLRDWTGLQTGVDVEAWMSWRNAMPETWKPAAVPAAVEHPYESNARLLGVPVISNRPAILVDMTGWMDKRNAAGVSQKTRFKKELGTLLKAMPENSFFKLIPYASVPLKCGTETLLDTRQDSINLALQCIGEVPAKARERDNFLDAAQLAIDSNVDTILVVTDSAPMGSSHVHPDLVHDQWWEMNRFQAAFLEVVLVGADEAAERQWTTLTKILGGTVTKVDP